MATMDTPQSVSTCLPVSGEERWFFPDVEVFVESIDYKIYDSFVSEVEEEVSAVRK